MKKLAIIIILLCHSLQAFSCTTFILKDANKYVFGRNLDWFSDNGIVVVNKRGVEKTSLVFPPDKTTSWTSKYGSISFNQFGKELPFGGINEKGLVVEVMTVYGEKLAYDDRTAVNELQWVQYQLDNSSTVDEVLATDGLIRISRVNQSLHYLVSDSEGNTAVVEFTKDGMQAYKGENLPIPVLENDRYEESLRKYKAGEESRFCSAAKLIDQYNPTRDNMIDYSFDILNDVALDGSWSVVYDIKNMQIHFKTASNRSVRSIDVTAFDFTCETAGLLYDLERNDSEAINAFFVPYKDSINKEKLKEAMESNGIEFPKEILRTFYNYAMTCSCTVE